MNVVRVYQIWPSIFYGLLSIRYLLLRHIFGRILCSQLNCNSKNGWHVVNFLSTRWSTDGSTSSEPMRLCMTAMVKAQIDNHTLDDRNHQGHHTTLLLSETLLSTAQASLCVGEVRSLESTGSPCGEFWSQISTCILAGYRLNKSLHLTTSGSEWSCASGFATRLTLCQTYLTMSGFRPRHIFCCQVTRTLRTTSSGVAHPLSTVCKGHYTLWSAPPGLPFPNMASLDHSGSRTTTSSLWESTPSDMSRCLASSGQHLVDGEGLQGPPVVPAGWYHTHSSNESLAWLQQHFPDRRISRRCDLQWSPHSPDLNPQIFICGNILRTGYMAITPRISLTWRQQ